MLRKSSKLCLFLEKIFWAYLFINPLIDFATGYYISEFLGATELDIQSSSFGSTPGLYIRMFMLVLFTLYLLLKKDRPAIFTLAAMGVAWAASIAVLLLRGTSLILSVDIKYFVKYCYNVVVLFAYAAVLISTADDKPRLMKRIRALVCSTCIMYSLAIIIPYCLQVGYFTYADRLGYRGSRGFFTSANDVTAVFVILLPIALATMLDMDRALGAATKLLYVLTPAFSFAAMIIIGSKTAFLSSFFSIIALLIACIFGRRDRRRQRLWRFLAMLLALLLIFLVICLAVGGEKLRNDIYKCIIAPMLFAENEDLETAVLSGRSDKLGAQFAAFVGGGLPTLLFGIGRSTVELIIEMDIFEVIIYYGIVGAAAMLWIYILLAVDFFRGFGKKRDIRSFAYFLGIGLAAGYLILSGHVLFTVTSGQYFVFAILLSRLYFSDTPEGVRIKPYPIPRKSL